MQNTKILDKQNSHSHVLFFASLFIHITKTQYHFSKCVRIWKLVSNETIKKNPQLSEQSLDYSAANVIVNLFLNGAFNMSNKTIFVS